MAESVWRGVFVDAISVDCVEGVVGNPPAGVEMLASLLEALLSGGRDEETFSDAQAVVLFEYLVRTLPAMQLQLCGSERARTALQPWFVIAVRKLDCISSRLQSLLSEFLLMLLQTDELFAVSLLRTIVDAPLHHIASRGIWEGEGRATSIDVKILTEYAAARPGNFYNLINNWLERSDDSSTHYALLSLLSHVLSRVPPECRARLSGASLWCTLLSRLRIESDEESMVLALRSLVTVVPYVAHSLPVHLSDLLLVLKRLIVFAELRRNDGGSGPDAMTTGGAVSKLALRRGHYGIGPFPSNARRQPLMKAATALGLDATDVTTAADGCCRSDGEGGGEDEEEFSDDDELLTHTAHREWIDRRRFQLGGERTSDDAPTGWWRARKVEVRVSSDLSRAKEDADSSAACPPQPPAQRISQLIFTVEDISGDTITLEHGEHPASGPSFAERRSSRADDSVGSTDAAGPGSTHHGDGAASASDENRFVPDVDVVFAFEHMRGGGGGGGGDISATGENCEVLQQIKTHFAPRQRRLGQFPCSSPLSLRSDMSQGEDEVGEEGSPRRSTECRVLVGIQLCTNRRTYAWVGEPPPHAADDPAHGDDEKSEQHLHSVHTLASQSPDEIVGLMSRVEADAGIVALGAVACRSSHSAWLRQNILRAGEPSPELQRMTQRVFEQVFALFPWHCIRYLRTECVANQQRAEWHRQQEQRQRQRQTNEDAAHLFKLTASGSAEATFEIAPASREVEDGASLFVERSCALLLSVRAHPSLIAGDEDAELRDPVWSDMTAPEITNYIDNISISVQTAAPSLTAAERGASRNAAWINAVEKFRDVQMDLGRDLLSAKASNAEGPWMAGSVCTTAIDAGSMARMSDSSTEITTRATLIGSAAALKNDTSPADLRREQRKRRQRQRRRRSTPSVASVARDATNAALEHAQQQRRRRRSLPPSSPIAPRAQDIVRDQPHRPTADDSSSTSSSSSDDEVYHNNNTRQRSGSVGSSGNSDGGGGGDVVGEKMGKGVAAKISAAKVRHEETLSTLRNSLDLYPQRSSTSSESKFAEATATASTSGDIPTAVARLHTDGSGGRADAPSVGDGRDATVVALQRRVLLLSSELDFERQLRLTQYDELCEARQRLQEQHDHQAEKAAKAIFAEQRKAHLMKQEIAEEHRRRTERLQQQNKKYVGELTKKLVKATQSRQQIMTDMQLLQSARSEDQFCVQHLQRELNAYASELTQLRGQAALAQQTQLRLFDSEEKINVLTQEVAHWERYHQDRFNSSMSSQLSERDGDIARLNRDLCAAHAALDAAGAALDGGSLPGASDPVIPAMEALAVANHRRGGRNASGSHFRERMDAGTSSQENGDGGGGDSGDFSLSGHWREQAVRAGREHGHALCNAASRLKRRIVELEEEADGRTTAVQSLQHMLVRQQQATDEKIAVIQQKYETIKSLNLVLERRVVELKHKLEEAHAPRSNADQKSPPALARLAHTHAFAGTFAKTSSPTSRGVGMNLTTPTKNQPQPQHPQSGGGTFDTASPIMRTPGGAARPQADDISPLLRHYPANMNSARRREAASSGGGAVKATAVKATAAAGGGDLFGETNRNEPRLNTDGPSSAGGRGAGGGHQQTVDTSGGGGGGGGGGGRSPATGSDAAADDGGSLSSGGSSAAKDDRQGRAGLPARLGSIMSGLLGSYRNKPSPEQQNDGADSPVGQGP